MVQQNYLFVVLILKILLNEFLIYALIKNLNHIRVKVLYLILKKQL